MTFADTQRASSLSDYICPDLPSTWDLTYSLQTLSYQVSLSDTKYESYNSGSDEEKAQITAQVESSIIKSSYITQTFNPNFWNKNGFNNYVLLEWRFNNLDLTKRV